MSKLLLVFVAMAGGLAVPLFSMPDSPTNLVGAQRYKLFLVQKELVNILVWDAPLNTESIVSYGLYQDIFLTELVATIPAAAELEYQDNNKREDASYTYYLVSQDAFGDVSLPVIITLGPQARCAQGVSVNNL